MLSKDELLLSIIPYRLEAVVICNYALKLRSSFKEPKPMKIFLSDVQYIEGLSTAFLNPSIEVGVIHSRALLDFLGLKIDEKKNLVNRKGKRSDDFGIEDFANEKGPLPLVSPEEVKSKYQGDPREAEEALIAVINTANKGIAHNTSGSFRSPEQERLLEIATRGIPKLFVNFFYNRLKLTPPTIQLITRPANQ